MQQSAFSPQPELDDSVMMPITEEEKIKSRSLINSALPPNEQADNSKMQHLLSVGNYTPKDSVSGQ